MTEGKEEFDGDFPTHEESALGNDEGAGPNHVEPKTEVVRRVVNLPPIPMNPLVLAVIVVLVTTATIRIIGTNKTGVLAATIVIIAVIAQQAWSLYQENKAR